MSCGETRASSTVFLVRNPLIPLPLRDSVECDADASTVWDRAAQWHSLHVSRSMIAPTIPPRECKEGSAHHLLAPRPQSAGAMMMKGESCKSKPDAPKRRWLKGSSYAIRARAHHTFITLPFMQARQQDRHANNILHFPSPCVPQLQPLPGQPGCAPGLYSEAEPRADDSCTWSSISKLEGGVPGSAEMCVKIGG